MRIQDIQEALRRLWRKTDPLKINQHVADSAYLRQGDAVLPVDIESVTSAAGILESSLAMAEDLPETVPISLSLTKKELNSFVCYMRQLDTAYREQGKFVATRLKSTGMINELKATEEAQEVSPQRYAELTGQGSR